jgi:tripartite-type tricarboxylate transporter receptor subunit TctC
VALIGVFAHKDTPEEVRKILSDAFKKTFEDPEFKKGIEKIGDEPRFGGPELMIESIKRQEEVTIPILKELGTYVGN